ncbi:MAG: hypothetical protein KBT04_00325 [Bacteroidales bacterium]|nr:hypothetical protein [Candidatus Colimorpha onthohippi]
MKNQYVISFLILLAAGSVLVAQNSFKGRVKYKVESTGQVAFQLPAEAAEAEILVSGSDIFTKSAIFMSTPFSEAVLVNDLKVTICENYSQLLDFLRNQGSEFTYQGSGKLLTRQTASQQDIDSLVIPDNEPGHFYLEYVDGETKEIAGVVAKKVIRHAFDAEGVDHPAEMWYNDQMGPQYNFLFLGIKGIPLMCTQDMGDGKAVTYTATEIVKGKVKATDFMLPDGYETLSDTDLRTFATELQEEIELMNE